MNPEYRVDELVPLSGKMSLLHNIVGHGEGWLHAEVNITSDSMFANDHGVPAWIGLEYMAQTIGAYAGLQERLMGGPPKIGFLLGSRKYKCSTDNFIFGQTLLLKIDLQVTAENGLNVFNCEIQGQDVVASAVVLVFQPDDAEEFFNESLA